MTNNNSPIWITIPDEQPAPKRLPAEKKQSPDKVQNKIFWSAGFVALIAFGIILFLPNQFSQQLMQAQLFDGGFQVVPDYEEQTQDNAFFGGDGEIPAEQGGVTEDQPVSAEEASLEQVDSQNVIEAQAEPVEIQIEPLADQPIQTEEQTVTETQSEPQVVDGTIGTTDEVTPEVLEPAQTQADDELTQMVANLTAELENLKADSAQKDQEIENLSQILTSGLQPSAPEQAIPVVTTSQTSSQSMDNGGSYRYNTHTVTVSPHEVLAQNQLSTSQLQQRALQGNIVQGAQNYNTVLSGVQNQPETGPAETMLLAFVLASVAVLGYGIFRTARA